MTGNKCRYWPSSTLLARVKMEAHPPDDGGDTLTFTSRDRTPHFWQFWKFQAAL
jgi:hypothetical protein